ncbi:hypothetical protein SB775_16950 [Peribacillus sp. SIMBA_075]|uniref:hypothetical protein n=1 Tax=Peribacillus sp. SIMBA_075 TaxID=3085813 RepID=UPI00397E437C
MDALVQEVNGVATANQSCGHDPHSTIVLYLYLALAIASAESALNLLSDLYFSLRKKKEKALFK